jgi:hypothetical protein
MIRTITKVAIQISYNHVIKFIYYNNNEDDFSFTSYKNLEMAIEELPKDSIDFPLATHEYVKITFDKNGNIQKTNYTF